MSSTAFMDQFGDVIYNNYNATEAGMIATATPADLRAAPDTAGKPRRGTEIRILGQRFPRGAHRRGRTDLRAATAPSSTATPRERPRTSTTASWRRATWATSTTNGRLFVVGRDDEMIVSGGENVYPIEVEKTLASHPDVAEAAVIGVDDEQYGQRLAAFVVLERRRAARHPTTLKQHVRDNLANYKVPREITVLDELPRSITGKIVRKRPPSPRRQ